MPPMPPRVRAIKKAIEERQDFSTLADGGEAEVMQYARRSGQRGGALILEWQGNYRQRQAAGPRQQKAAATRHILSHDLDFWSFDDEPADPDECDPDDDDDDGDNDDCATCRGTGRVSCRACNGTGKVPADER